MVVSTFINKNVVEPLGVSKRIQSINQGRVLTFTKQPGIEYCHEQQDVFSPDIRKLKKREECNDSAENADNVTQSYQNFMVLKEFLFRQGGVHSSQVKIK